MIQRINLIEREAFRVTYGTILKAFGVSFFICLVMYLIVALSAVQTATHIRLLTGDIERLKVEREKLMNRENSTQATGPLKDIVFQLEKRPPWSQLLGNIAATLPANVWLASLKGFDKEEASSKKGIIFNGSAKTAQGVSALLANLEASPYFEKVVLTSSKEEGGVFNFSVTCDITQTQSHP